MTAKILLIVMLMGISLVISGFSGAQIKSVSHPHTHEYAEIVTFSEFRVDFSLGILSQELQTAIINFLLTNPDVIPENIWDFTLTVQYEDKDGIQHIALMPTEVYASNWHISVTEEDIIRLAINQNVSNGLQIYSEREYIRSLVENLVSNDYRFPWTGGHTWVKTQGFHYTNLGYSLDFIPNGNPPTVLSIEAGTLTGMCYIPSDPYQAMVKVAHSGGVESGYLHLTKSSVPASDFNTTIQRGKNLGQLFNQAIHSNGACAAHPSLMYNTPCGCGTAMHLHFETNALISIQGTGLQAISNSANGTQYTSTNSVDTSAPTASANVTSGTIGQNGWYTTNVQITITANDNTGGSGVKNVQRRINNGSWQTTNSSSSTFTVSTEGINVVEYRSEDNAGNISTVQSVIVPIDKTNPTLSSVVINNGSPQTNQVNVQVKSTASDAHSGLWQIGLSTDNTIWSWQGYNATTGASIPATNLQNHTLYVQVKDYSGRISTMASDGIVLELYPERPSSNQYRLCASSFNTSGQAGTQSTSYRLTSSIGSNVGGASSGNSTTNAQSGFLAAVQACRALGANAQWPIYLPLVRR